MFKLILHHTYKFQGEAIDISRNGSHGLRRSTVYEPQGMTSASGALRFEASDSQVRVPNGPVWQNPAALRIEVLAYVTEPGSGPRRLNLVEGEYSFAFFIHPDRTLWGTFRAPQEEGGQPVWHGANSLQHSPDGNPVLVPFNQWVKLTYEHDGIGCIRLFVNGQLVAANYQLISAVASVQNNGVFIGHWPGDGRFTFSGKIDELKIWKYDPHSLYRQFFCRDLTSEQWLCWKAIFSAMAKQLQDPRHRDCFIELMQCVRNAQLKLMRTIRAKGEPGKHFSVKYRKRYQSLWCRNQMDGPEMAMLMNDWSTALVELVGEEPFQEYQQTIADCWKKHGCASEAFEKVSRCVAKTDQAFAGFIANLNDLDPRRLQRETPGKGRGGIGSKGKAAPANVLRPATKSPLLRKLQEKDS